MTMTKEDLMNEAFDAGLVALGAVGVGFVSKKVLKDGLGAEFFAGAGFLFSKLNHRGYEDEIKRQNKAIEKLTKAK